MKKYLLIAVLAIASIAAYAQPRAVGINVGYGAAVSYQHGFGEANMLDISVTVPQFEGIGGDQFTICAVQSGSHLIHHVLR